MKFALIGYGKMGKFIEQTIKEQNRGDEIVLKIGRNNLHDLTVHNLQKADVVFEFTQPDAVVANISLCFEAGVPVVVGTTGWSDRIDEIRDVCVRENGGLFYSPNFSIGVNIFFEINRRLAIMMNNQPQYDLAMEEVHHIEKMDAPSGTAIRTAEVIMGNLARKSKWLLDEQANTVTGCDFSLSSTSVHPSDSLLITAKREPYAPGTHIVTYSSEADEIQIIHRAKTRKGFAEGATTAARWMAGRKGIYEMKDILSFGGLS